MSRQERQLPASKDEVKQRLLSLIADDAQDIIDDAREAGLLGTNNGRQIMATLSAATEQCFAVVDRKEQQ